VTALTVAPPPAPAVLSQSLGHLVERWIEPLPRRPRLPERVSEATRTEAGLAERRQRQACRPVSALRVREWLAPVASAVRNPPAADDFEKRAAVIAAVCQDLPAAVFTPQTQREACSKFQFWPSAADVFELLESHAKPMRDTLSALEALANAPVQAPEPAEPWHPPTEAEKEAVSAQARAVVAEFRAMSKPEPLVDPRVAHFGPELLRAAYEAQAKLGGTAANLAYARLAMLPQRERREDREDWGDE